MASISTVFINNLVEILLTVILTVNVGAWKFLFDRTKTIEQETEKNSESITMLLNRIFGVDEDSTDIGHLAETEQRFDNINEKLDTISSEIEKNEKERKKEHQKVYTMMVNMVETLSDEEELEFSKSDLK
jgi:vacuolar-type H+-ATPase subunit I/STV1